MLERDLLLDADGDLVIENFDLKLTPLEDIVPQRIKRALKLFKGEWFLDTELGMPYYQELLGSKNSLDAVSAVFVSAIRGVEGVKEITAFNIDYEASTRTAIMTCTIVDEIGQQAEIEMDI